MQYKAYKDQCFLIGLCVKCEGDFFDGFVDLSPKERKEFEAVEKKYFIWQEILRTRYKKRII